MFVLLIVLLIQVIKAHFFHFYLLFMPMKKVNQLHWKWIPPFYSSAIPNSLSLNKKRKYGQFVPLKNMISINALRIYLPSLIH